MRTIKQHYELLELQDREKFAAMNGMLASKMTPSGGNCLDHFKRSVAEKQAKGGHVDTAVIYGWIQRAMIEYLGFTVDDIWNNTVPDLPVVKPETEAVTA